MKTMKKKANFVSLLEETSHVDVHGTRLRVTTCLGNVCGRAFALVGWDGCEVRLCVTRVPVCPVKTRQPCYSVCPGWGIHILV
jgi:hypothetical protein